MKTSLSNIAKELACLFNNIDMYEIDSKSSPSLAGRYALASDLLIAKTEGMISVLRSLGYNVQVEGISLRHTVHISLSSSYSSPRFSNNYRRAV